MIGMFRPLSIRSLGIPLALAVVLGNTNATGALAQQAPPPLEEFSPALLGIYRKVMNIESEIIRHSGQYDVDVALARAVCMYESGGNASLTSSAGANGYFQVMPATFRLMRVETNIEAGIKYLGGLVRQFGREDYALAAYNGGPGRVARRAAMPLETLQYVIGVGAYRSLLRVYGPSIRAYAAQLRVTSVREGDNWWTLSERLGLSVVQLRLHNPFLAARPLRPGYVIVYPSEPRNDLFAADRSHYRMRLGDNYLNLAFALGVEVDLMRETNGLWRLQPALPGTELTIPFDPDAKFVQYTVRAGDRLADVAARLKADPWSIVRDNHVWDEELREGAVLRILQAPPPPTFRVHRVQRGDTLIGLARRYDTTVRAIQAANGLGTRTLVRIGQRLRIPLD